MVVAQAARKRRHRAKDKNSGVRGVFIGSGKENLFLVVIRFTSVQVGVLEGENALVRGCKSDGEFQPGFPDVG